MRNINRDFQNFLRTLDGIETGDMEFEGKYQIPKMQDIQLLDTEAAKNWDFVGYNLASSVKMEDRPNMLVHFFLDDYLFERVWSRITVNIDLLGCFDGCLSPDFSQYTNMPSALRIYNHYRKMWLSVYWQMYDIDVIPVLGWSDKESLEYCCDGMPHNSLVAVSSLGCQNNSKEFEYGYKYCINKLEPTTILWFGKPFDWLTDTKNIIFRQGGYFNKDNRPKDKRGRKKKAENIVDEVSEVSANDGGEED